MASPDKKRRLVVWLSSAMAIVLLLGLLILILALTVFKAKHPVVTVNSINVSDLDFQIDVLKFRVNFNISLEANITVDNPNRVGFKFSNSSAHLRFKAQDVGEIPIPAGEIRARDSTTMVLTLVLMTDRLLSDSDFYKEVVAGTLHFQTFIRLSGKVRVVFAIHVVSYTTCDLDINRDTRMAYNQTCHYKIKL